MDADGLSRLLAPEGWALLSALPPYDERLAMPLGERLRAEGLHPSLVAAALTQSRLRAKAHAKLGDFADGMLFTPAGLEQATRLEVAAHHARRYRDAGLTHVADLTCGIGADALAFAGVGLRVTAAELDEMTAAIATVNLRHFPEVVVRHTDGLALDLADVDGVYADPARRTGGGSRIHDPAAYAPPLDAVLAVRERVPALGLKLGPGVAHRDLPADARAQWVSVEGDVVELGLWFGPLAPEGPGRSALVLANDTAHVLAPDEPAHAHVGEVGGYLYEPDGAVIRAGLVGDVALDVRGRLVDPTIAYVTSDERSATPFATGYRVLDRMPFGLKRLRTYLRERGVGRLTIKKRGTAVVPEQLRRQLDLRGGATSTIVLTRIAGQQSVLVVEPLDRPDPAPTGPVGTSPGDA
ncbi:class I SAM-dependent methyltransferase [Cellulomonas palmilytica]|uniref:class I SAM-dependent methyltransferase n=1 Tax=Cellulomonas palmilytica TaxID=2608402 RepID=UPI001F320D88|nr:class I SAM-dependent methyltransferase [Cellulomonas palmilytica]UJP39739.1 class I SAM-dependent methyltransferase [Cellulomonas palmilytica]